MFEDNETWENFLDLVTFHGSLGKLAVEKFKKCDPSVTCRVRSNLEDRRNYSRDLKRAKPLYDFLEGKQWIEFVSDSDKFQETLNWLSEEYKNPKHIKRFPCSENTAQKLDRLLCDLNYLEQRQKIKTEISGFEIAKVVLIQANGEFTQRWLTKRLSLEVVDHDRSQGFSVVAKPKWNKDLRGFWQVLAQQTNTSEDPSEIIQTLCRRCQYQPLIMAIYGIQSINSACLDQIITTFWQKLIKNISEQPWHNEHGDCILFLTTDLEKHQSIEFYTCHGVDLAPWEFVTIDHMKQWLKPMEVKKLNEECDGEISKLIPSGRDDPLKSPEKMLNNICLAVDLNGCADLELYWKIAL